MNGLSKSKKSSTKVMTPISQHFTSTPMSGCVWFKRNKMRLIILFCLSLMVCLQTEAGPKGKRVLTGESVETLPVVQVDEDSYLGIGFKDASELKKYFAIQMIVFLFLLGSKIVDWWKQGKDHSAKDIKEMKEAWLKSVGDLEYIKKHMMTENDVMKKVREEIKYIKDHGGRI